MTQNPRIDAVYVNENDSHHSIPEERMSHLRNTPDRYRGSQSTPMSQKFDAIVVGAGQAGPSLVDRLATAGMTVAIVERHLFGGTCVNTGCTPTKTLVASAEVIHQARRAAEYGIRIEGGTITADLRAVKARKEKIVDASRTGLEIWLRGMKNCTVFKGHARFESPNSLRVGDDLITADRIFLNVGGRAHVPNLPGLDEVPYLTNTSILELEALPRHL